MPTYNAKQLLDLQLPDQEWVIDGGLLIPGSKMAVIGPKKSWKSMFVSIDMALKLGIGFPWAGFNTIQRRVLVIQEEIPLIAFRDRVQVYLNGHGMLPPPSVHFNNDMVKLGGHATYGFNNLKIELKKLQIDVLIIDPLYKVMYGDLSNSTDMTNFTDAIDKLIEEMNGNLSVVIIHHTGKATFASDGWAIDRGAHASLGSSVLNNWYDTGIMIQPDSVDEITVKFEDLRLAPVLVPPKKFRVDRDTLSFVEQEGKLSYGLLEH